MMKRITSIIIIMAMMVTCFVPSMAHASDNDIKYTYDSDTKTLIFSGTGIIAETEDEMKYKDKYFNTAEHIVIKDGITGIGYGAFWGFGKVKTVEFPEEMQSLGSNAFASCHKLQEIHLPDGIVDYGSDIFTDCINLETIYFGKSPKTMEVSYSMTNIFQNCQKLKNIYVPKGNTVFNVKDGVLFAGTTLLCYPQTKEDKQYEIPEGTTSIGYHAFYINKYLEKVDIPNTIMEISCSFCLCSSLTSLTIPASLEWSFGEEVISSCYKLKYIKNDSNVKLKVGSYYYDPAGLEFWVDRETGKYINSIANGTADRVILGDHKNKGDTIKVDGVTYKLTEDAKYLTTDQMNNGVARADVKAVKFADEYSISPKVKHKGWYYNVINPNASPVSQIVTATVNYTGARLINSDYDSIYMSWKKVSALGPKVSYKVESKKQGGKWTVVNKTATVNSCTLKDLADGAKYFIRVTPHITVNGKTYYGKAKVSTGIYTLKKLNKPNVTKAGSGKVKVTWNNINGETGYEIYKSAKMNKNFKLAKRVTSTTAKSTTLKVDAKKKYYYKVRAYKKININGGSYKVYGPWSSVKGYKLK